MKNLILAFAAAGMTLMAVDQNNPKPMADREINKLANAARSAADHRDVARHYEARADYFDSKARIHEANADELKNRTGYNPMQHKWPAMVQAPIDRQRANAMEARRAASESRELAAKHIGIATRMEASAE